MAGIGEPKEVGKVVAIAYRPTDGDAMRKLSECVVAEKRGLELENRKHGKRELTLLTQEAWDVVCHELGAELSWHTRRARRWRRVHRRPCPRERSRRPRRAVGR